MSASRSRSGSRQPGSPPAPQEAPIAGNRAERRGHAKKRGAGSPSKNEFHVHENQTGGPRRWARKTG